jgi:hypothetical protein
MIRSIEKKTQWPHRDLKLRPSGLWRSASSNYATRWRNKLKRVVTKVEDELFRMRAQWLFSWTKCHQSGLSKSSVGIEFYHSLTHGAEPFLRSCQLCSYSRNSEQFMEPESSLPCSQEPSTIPILNQINPIHTIPSYLFKIHFNIVHPPTSCLSKESVQVRGCFRINVTRILSHFPICHIFHHSLHFTIFWFCS